MILCQCAGVSQATVEQLVERGMSSVGAIARRCGAGRYCDSCRAEIRSILSRSRRAAEPSVEADAGMLDAD